MASFERSSDADQRSGFATVAGWIRDAPKSGDLLALVFARSTSERQARLAAADELERQWAERKRVNGAATPLDRQAVIGQLRRVRGQVPDEQWRTLLERYAVTEAELDVDEIDWNPPPPSGHEVARP